MKCGFLIIALINFSTLIYSQVDSCFNLTPGWVKGENKNIKMLFSQNFPYGDTVYDMKMKNDMALTVSNIIKDTVYIELCMKDITLSGIPSEAKDLLSFNLNDIVYKAKINSHGNFIDLINTDELLEKYLNVLIAGAKKWGYSDSTITKSFWDNRELYKSKITQDASNIISTFFYPFSIVFPVNGFTLKINKDVIDRDTIISAEKIKLIEENGNEYTYSVDMEVDSVNISKLISHYKNIGKSTEMIEAYKSSKPEISYMLTINRSTGWVTYIKKSGSIKMNNMVIQQVTEYFVL